MTSEMTRETAIANLKADIKYWEGTMVSTEHLSMAIKALEQEPCEDCISRKAVLEQIHCWIGSGEYRYAMAERFLIDRIKTLPSANQAPKMIDPHEGEVSE